MPKEDNDNDGGSSYEAAVSALLSPIHQATTPQALREAALRRTNTLQDMQIYLHRLGLDLNGTDAKSNNNNDDNKNDNCSGKEESITTTSTTQANDTDIKNSNNYYHIPSLIFHVTGTKGKGSTLSLCESILRNAYGLNTGLFTSPHLVNICERIRINGAPISKLMFGKVYWSVRHLLEKNHDHDIGVEGEDNATSLPPLPILPGYFRMLTLMALYTFCHHQTRPKIDVILLEVGMGGRYDATNVFEPMAQSSALSPPSSFTTNHDYDHDPTTSLKFSQHKNDERRILLVRGVTLIDYDHTRILGSTLSQIAWEKGGIYMRNKLQCIGRNDGGYDKFVAQHCKTITTNDASFSNNGEGQVDNTLLSPHSQPLTMQPTVFVSGNNNSSEVLPVLDRIAKCNGSQLQIVHDASIESFSQIGLQGDHQRSNAALALAMCRYAMNQRQQSCNASMLTIRDALSKTFWPGRCHTVQYPIPHNLKLTMNLRCDGAHTPLSMRACIEWFRRVVVVIANSSNNRSRADTSTLQQQRKFLIFNCGHDRNPIPLIYSLYTSNVEFESIYFCHADFERPSAVPKRLEETWRLERLVSELDVARGESNVDLTFQSMCHKLQSIADASTAAAATTDHNPSLVIQCNGITNLLSELSTSTTSSWQETLANVWKVIHMYSREFDNSGGGGGSENVWSECCNKIVCGLNVKEALTLIQEKVTSTNTIEDSNDGDDSKNGLVVEVCVTGSLYIVGSALAAAGWEEGNTAD